MKLYHQMFLKMIEENQNIIEKKIEKNPKFLEKILNLSVKKSSEILFKNLNKDKKNIILDNKKIEKDFNRRLYKKWKGPIDNLEALIGISYEGGVMFTESFIEEAKKENNLVFYSLRAIHARAVLTAKECLILLKNGYPDGAFSRWRTIYELSVIGGLLVDIKDNDLCERYLNFFYVQAYKEEKLNREKGYPSYDEDSFKSLKNNYDYMVKKYGKNYVNGDYGWANKLFDKDRVYFSDIENAANMEKLKGYYKSSSMYIHGNYKASKESLGIMPNIEEILLVGPSNYGLSIPMQNVAISLYSISTFFFLIYPTIDTMSTCLIMEKFMKKILISADRIQTKMENDEMRLD